MRVGATHHGALILEAALGAMSQLGIGVRRPAAELDPHLDIVQPWIVRRRVNVQLGPAQGHVA